MSLAEELANLGKEMTTSFDARINFLGENISDTKNLIGHFAKDHKAMGRKLRANLGDFVDNLTGTVDGLRAKFQKEQNAVHRECKETHSAWMSVVKGLASKRRNLNGNLTKKIKQKASRSR